MLKKEQKRRICHVQRGVTSLLLIALTLVGLVAFTAKVVVPIGGKIVDTQCQMIHYYTSIKNAEGERDSYSRQAKEYSSLNPTYAHILQKQADAADQEVDELTEARKELRKSSDTVVSWAASSYVSLWKLGLGLGILLGWVLVLYKFYINFWKCMRVIVRASFMVFRMFFSLLIMLSTRFTRFNAFERWVYSYPTGKKVKKNNTVPNNVVRLPRSNKNRQNNSRRMG